MNNHYNGFMKGHNFENLGTISNVRIFKPNTDLCQLTIMLLCMKIEQLKLTFLTLSELFLNILIKKIPLITAVYTYVI